MTRLTMITMKICEHHLKHHEYMYLLMVWMHKVSPILQIFFWHCIHSVDPENPLVHVNFPFVNGVQYADVVIPCKPTSKKVQLELIKDGDEVCRTMKRKCDFFFFFNQRIAFVWPKSFDTGKVLFLLWLEEHNDHESNQEIYAFNICKFNDSIMTFYDGCLHMFRSNTFLNIKCTN